MIKNIFYFKSINKIGGTEQFLYEIAKKYNEYDIAIYYDKINAYQLSRLSRYVRCIKRVPGQKVYCDRAFYSYNIDMIEDVVANEHIFVSHTIYQSLGITPPINNPKLTRFVGVSKYSAEMLQKYADDHNMNIKVECCYNPLMLEPINKIKLLVSACRLGDKIKGGKRTMELISALDRYSATHTNANYLWLIFSPWVGDMIRSPNVIVMEPRIDIRPYLASADWVIQLSDDVEGYCYTINEALGYGVPIVTTPLTVLDEFDVSQKLIYNWDSSNAPEIAEKIFTMQFDDFTYTPPRDTWDELLNKTPSTYVQNRSDFNGVSVFVQCIRAYYDLELEKKIYPTDPPFEVDTVRAKQLIDKALVKLVGGNG